MNTYSLIRSKTFWTIIAMFIVGGGNAIIPVIPEGLQASLELMLTIIASIFHLSTAQKSGATN